MIAMQTTSAKSVLTADEKMDISSSSDTDDDYSQISSIFDISTKSDIRVNEHCIAKYTNHESILNIQKKACKILHFSSKWNFDVIQEIIGRLGHKSHFNLFTISIETDNIVKSEANCDIIQNSLLNFDKNRVFLIQLISTCGKITKYYYRADGVGEFKSINFENVKKIEDFPTFLSTFLSGNIKLFEDELINNLINMKESTIILRFLRTLNMTQIFWDKLILKCAACGSRDDLLAAIDAPFSKMNLNLKSQSALSNTIIVAESSTKSNSNESHDVIRVSSVLYEAIKNNNKKIVEYLISNCSYFIQELPIDHKIEISSCAFKDGDYHILCNLIELNDFPFPKNLSPSNLHNERLITLAEVRKNIHFAIEHHSLTEIENTLKKIGNQRNCFSLNNKSLLKQALDCSRSNVHKLLKMYGYQTAEYEKLNDHKTLNSVEKTDIITILFNKSFIGNEHNRDENHKMMQIKRWFKEINMIGYAAEILAIAASCEDLKIIFDFEFSLVDHVSLSEPSASICTSFIFIGSKVTDKRRDHEIKGMIIHELCHYVFNLVFDNNQKPYYKHSIDLANNLDKIVKKNDKWSETQSNEPDDEFDGTISSVFYTFPPQYYHLELIVRVVQILVQYNEDKERLKCFKEKYEDIYYFWILNVHPEMKRYLMRNDQIINFNQQMELLPIVKDSKIKLSQSKIIMFEPSDCISLIYTNNAKLLFIDFFMENIKSNGCLYDSKNIYLSVEKLKDEKIYEELKEIIRNNFCLNIFIDCSIEIFENSVISLIDETCFIIFIATNEKDFTQMNQMISDKKMITKKHEINYDWNDLSKETQMLLLKKKIHFQNNQNISLIQLLTDDFNEEECEENINQILDKDLSLLIDDEILDLLVSDNNILINVKWDETSKESSFEYVAKERNFIEKKSKSVISQNDLIKFTQNHKYVLISDIAGSGKSWALRNISNVIREQHPTKWVSFFDLKLFIEEFKAHNNDMDFSTFFLEKILKPTQKFESKIFQQLYKEGKVFILFDGFDEIPPNCAEFMSNLAQSFQSNGGNQLWIATRDYFEVVLQHKLQVSHVYKLCEFSKEESVDLIASTWVLMDIKYENITIEDVKLHQNFSDYREKASKIIQKIVENNFSFNGYPNLLNIIAYGFKDDYNLSIEFNQYNIIDFYVKKLYKIWSCEKGQLRTQASSSSIFELNFFKLHQYNAIKSLFPKLANDSFPNYDDNEWSEGEIVACGIMYKKDGNYNFQHEVLREYFVAKFFEDRLEYNYNSNMNDMVLDVFVQILANKKFFMIQIFLNNLLHINNVQLGLTKYLDKFHNMNHLEDLIAHDLDNLVILVTKVLRMGEYEQSGKIIKNIISKTFGVTKSPRSFKVLLHFLFEYVYISELKEFLNNEEIIKKLIKSELEIDDFGNLFRMIEMRMGREFIRETFQTDKNEENIFLLMCSMASVKYLELCFNLLHKYFSYFELSKLIVSRNKDGENILHIGVQGKNVDNFKYILNGLNTHLEKEELKKFLKEKSIKTQQTILHYSSFCNDIMFHKILWNNLLNVFLSTKELIDFIFQEDSENFCFFHNLVSICGTDIIEFIFDIFEKHAGLKLVFQVLKSKDIWNRNLLQLIASDSNSQTHENFIYIFEKLKTFHENNESFYNFLTKFDKNNNNLLHTVVSYSTPEITSFVLSEIEGITFNSQIQILLRNSGSNGQNLLQMAAEYNKSEETFTILWKLLNQYFMPNEILEFITHIDDFENNLLHTVVQYSSLEIVELTWNEIKNAAIKLDRKKLLELKNFRGKNVLDMSIKNSKNPKLYNFIKKLYDSYEIELNNFSLYSISNDTFGFEFLREFLESNDNKKDFMRLIEAVIEINLPKITFLLKHDIDVNCVDRRYLSAIDYAWINYIKDDKTSDELLIIEEILLILLKSNSKFPNRRIDFDYDEEPLEVRNFIDFTDHLKEIIKQFPNLSYFHEHNNEFILRDALRMQRIIVLNKVYSQGVSSKKSAEVQIDNENLPEAHIFVILLKIKIKSSERNFENYSCLKSTFKLINEIKSCSTILQLVAAWRELDICFDFTDDTDVPDRGDQSCTVIKINAKDLHDEKKKFNVYGVIVHELCHLALQITYMNNSNPYPMGESDQKLEFQKRFDKIKRQFEENRKLDAIIQNVFWLCLDDYQHKELIVRPMQIVMYYYDNPEKIMHNQKHFRKLFNYLDEFVFPEMEKTLPIIKMLQNRRFGITYEKLTDAMKSKILHSKVKFQGEETTFYEMFGNNSEILKLLNSNDIRRVLLKNEVLVYGNEMVINMNERQFKNESDELEKSFDDIVNEVSQSKVFILSGQAGEGKTVAFENLAMKLKIKYKSYWVILLNLEKYREILRKNLMNFEVINTEIIFIKILKINKPIEVKIFATLFKIGKIILLFDEFDQISPQYTDLFLRIFEESKENQIWISTRPHCTKMLETKLNTSSYKFVHLNRTEIFKIVNKVLSEPDDQRRSELVSFFDSLDCPINNPLMIKIITELSASNKIDLRSKYLNLYDIFDKIIDKFKENLYQKIPFEDNLAKTRFSSADLLNVYALKYIFEDKFQDKIKDLEILKNWETEKYNWNVDKNQRFGFLYTYNDGFSYKFVHKSFAEFFTVKYLISFFFDNSYYLKDGEYKKLLEIMFLIAEKSDFKNIRKFIFSYAETNYTKDYNIKFSSAITSNMSKILDNILNSHDCLDSFHLWVILLPHSCGSIIDYLTNDDDSMDDLKVEVLCQRIKDLKALM